MTRASDRPPLFEDIAEPLMKFGYLLAIERDRRERAERRCDAVRAQRDVISGLDADDPQTRARMHPRHSAFAEPQSTALLPFDFPAFLLFTKMLTLA